MDPITGIGLAASVIQLVTASIDAAKTCRELYQQGSVSKYSNLDYTTGRLASLTRLLQQSLQSSGTRSPALTGEEKDLVDLGGKCEDCANKLQRELHKLQTQPRASALEAARQAARAIWKRSRIDKIQQQLQAYQSTLETSLLSRLSQKFDAQGLLNDKSFANLDRNLQQIIMCLAKSQTRLTELVEKESEETRRSITAQFDRAERLQIRHRRYEEISNSLFYPDIFSRQEQVDDQFDGITDSYDWIFQEPQTYRMSKSNDSYPQNLAHRWDDFASWLKSGHGVYWINGKAGSGKSTIMKHICDHSRKLELLQEWASSRRLLTPTFFFWNAGSRLQKSIDGLLRSLLYQMLKECHDLVGCFTDEPLYTWTQSRLLTTLRNLISQSQVPIAICVFIDGLDEFEGREDTVIKMFEALADQAHVKVCLSSRPLPIFEEAFHGRPSLRLQDLTFDTIRDYAEDQLSELIEKRVSLNKDDGDLAQDLLTRIVKRADGVFLWAIIAIRDVRDGLRGIANLKELSQTIETLPSELESLFMLMLRRIKRAFMQDAAYFLGIALYQGSGPNDGMDLCRLHFSHSQRGQKDAPLSCEKISTDKLVASCRILEIRLLSHTGGLLELTSPKPPLYPDGLYGKRKDHDPILFREIKFAHRTARDFLLENNDAKSFLTHNGSSEAQIRLSIARGTLAQLLHFSRGDHEIVDEIRIHPIYSPYLGALHHISMAEMLLGTAQAKLMRSLDYKSLARDYLVTDGRKTALIIPEPFMVKRHATSIDLVGMAAATGMTFYVCERLNLEIESRRDFFSLPDLYNYSRNRTTAAKLSWNGGGQSRDMITSSATRLPSSDYRQALARCLQWETDTSFSSRTGTTTRTNRLAETYMLSCCRPWHTDLVSILLRAGANPMVEVVPDGKSTPSSGVRNCFWEWWLEILTVLHGEQLRSTWVFSEWRFILETNMRITTQDAFNITKGLLAQGADINHQLEDRYDLHLKRQPTLMYPVFTMTVSAMFILETCFNAEPEFREFAVAMEPLIETPKRQLIGVYPSPDLYRFPKSYKILEPCPSAEESSLLWPLIEKWEDTRTCDDLDALTLAIGEVWRAHNPGVKLRRLSDQLSNDDKSDEGDEDDDEDNEDKDDQDDESPSA